jgi:hypothetical protein
MFGQVRLVAIALVAACASKRGDGAPAAAYTGPAYKVATAAEPCVEGSPCAIRIDLSALGPFHVNREYPFRFEPDPAFDARALPETPIAVKDDRTASYRVGFQPARAGALRVAGTFKLSVCTDEECRIENEPIAVDVQVGPPPNR